MLIFTEKNCFAVTIVNFIFSNSLEDFTNNAFLISILVWRSFILRIFVVTSSLLVILEYALLNKEETALSLQLVWWWELYCRNWSVCVGLLYRDFSTSIKCQETFHYFLLHYFLPHCKLNVLMNITDMMENVFQVRMFSDLRSETKGSWFESGC